MQPQKGIPWRIITRCRMTGQWCSRIPVRIFGEKCIIDFASIYSQIEFLWRENADTGLRI